MRYSRDVDTRTFIIIIIVPLSFLLVPCSLQAFFLSFFFFFFFCLLLLLFCTYSYLLAVTVGVWKSTAVVAATCFRVSQVELNEICRKETVCICVNITLSLALYIYIYIY